MNEEQKRLAMQDMRDVLSTAAGRRVLGSVFYIACLNALRFDASNFAATGYYEGMRSVGLSVANAVRDVDPRGVAECEIAYGEFLKQFEEGDEESDGA